MLKSAKVASVNMSFSMSRVPPAVLTQVQGFLRRLPPQANDDDQAFQSVTDLLTELTGSDPNVPVHESTLDIEQITFASAVRQHDVVGVPDASIVIPDLIREIGSLTARDVVEYYRLRNPNDYFQLPINLNLFKAQLIVSRVPSVARIMALLTTGTQSTRFVPFKWRVDGHRQQPNNPLPWNPRTIEAVLNPSVPVHRGTLFGDKLNLIHTLRDMQSPVLLTMALFCIYIVVEYPQEHNVTMQVTMDTLTRRELTENMQVSVSFQPRQTNILYITKAVDEPGGLEELYHNVVRQVLLTVKGGGNSKYSIDPDADEAYVTGVNIMYELPNHSSSNAANFPVIARDDVKSFLYGLYAFGVPDELKKHPDYKKLTLYQPERDGHCVAGAYCYLRLLEAGELTMESASKHNKVNQRVQQMNVLATMNGSSTIMDYLDYLMRVDVTSSALFEKPFRSIHVVFLNTLAAPTKPLFPSVRITMQGEEPNFTIPPDDKYLFLDAEPDELVLVYFKAHVFVSMHGYVRDLVDCKGGIWDRITDDQTLHTPIAKPVYPMKCLPLTAEMKRKEAENPEQCIDAQLNIRKHAADFETGRCDLCSTATSDVQEAYCAALVTGFGEHKSFYGKQCCSDAASFEQSNGCIVQMLKYLVKISTSRCHKDRKRKEMVYFYNGANFDIMFIMKTMVHYNLKYEVVLQGSSIMMLRWEQFQFVDFMKILVPCRLDKLFKTFATFDYPEIVVYKPSMGKWKAFPYNVIGLERDLTDEELESDEVWEGNKKVDDEDPRDAKIQCLEWWRSRFGASGYKYREHLMDYCLDDTILLFYMIVIDARFLARGTVSLPKSDGTVATHYFNINDKITAASRSMKLFRQVFLRRVLYPPKGDILTECYDQKMKRCMRVDEIVRLSYMGGMVIKYYNSMQSVRIQAEKYKDMNKPMRGDSLDANSMYVYIMATHAMPVQYYAEKTYDPPMESDEFTQYNDTDLYKVDMTYPEGQDGTITKLSGFTVCLNHIPSEYDDPCYSHSMRHNYRWGVELNQALKAGCKIKVYHQLQFYADKIFAEFATYCHEQRLKDKKGVFGFSWKLTGNSQYGKWAESAHASVYIVHNLVDVPSEPGTVVEIRFIGHTRDGRPVYLVMKMLRSTPAPDQHKYIASFITAAARTHLMKAKQEMETQLYTDANIPTVCMYCDTDSWKIIFPNWDHLSSQSWYKKWVDQSRLGAFKSETDGVGFDEAYFLAKKVNILREYKPDSLYEDTVTAKGMNKSTIDNEAMISLARGEIQSMKVSIPIQFVRTFQEGVVKKVNVERTLKSRDKTRKPPDENGYCAAFNTVEEFINSLKTL
jgi:hypothetical protein